MGPPSGRQVRMGTAALVSGLSIVLSTSPADSEPRAPAPIVYERAAGAEVCPDARSALEIFRKQLGRSAPDLQRVRLRVAPRPGAAGEIEGQIELTDGDGGRRWAKELHARKDDCATLIASLAVSLRVALSAADRPEGASESSVAPDDVRQSAPGDVRQSVAGTAAEEEEPIVIQGVSLPPPPLVEIPGQRAGLRSRQPVDYRALDMPAYRLWASAAVATGAAPNAAARLSLGLAFHWRTVSLGFEVRGIPLAEGNLPGQSVRLARWESAFVPCVAEGVFIVCAVLFAGGVWAETKGVHHQTLTEFRAGGGGRGGIELPLSPHLALLAYIDLEATFWPVVVQASDLAVWREAAGQFALGLAVMGTFPGT